VVSPAGAVAEAAVVAGGAIEVSVACGPPLDPVVLRSCCIGAAYQALGWVTHEGLSVGDDGQVLDLTIRSFGILRAIDMPEVRVHIEGGWRRQGAGEGIRRRVRRRRLGRVGRPRLPAGVALCQGGDVTDRPGPAGDGG